MYRLARSGACGRCRPGRRAAAGAERPFGGQRPHPTNGRPIGWTEWLALAADGEAEAFERLRRATGTGRPCGDEAFVEIIEEQLGRTIGSRRRGRKPNPIEEDQNQLELF